MESDFQFLLHPVDPKNTTDMPAQHWQLGQKTSWWYQTFCRSTWRPQDILKSIWKGMRENCVRSLINNLQSTKHSLHGTVLTIFILTEKLWGLIFPCICFGLQAPLQTERTWDKVIRGMRDNQRHLESTAWQQKTPEWLCQNCHC